ncbi:MAG: peptidase S8, partial [Bacteroidota bacterium]
MKILYTFLLLNFSICFSQNNKYIIEFKDKNNSPYTISEPSAYLSPAAIERRLRQNIPIEFNDLPPNPNYIQNILNKGVKFLHQSRWFNSVTVSISDNSIIQEIRNLDCVKGIKKAEQKILALPYEYTVQSKYSKSNSIKKSVLNLTNDVYDYGQSLAQVNQIGGICMHNQGFDGRNRIICVMDAGFKNADTLSCFDSIRNNGQLLGTWDFVANEASVFEDNDHGAMVLSCMASNMPGVHIGTAPKASYWLLRTENAASELIIEEDNWMTGAEFADSVGADIINSSLGYT